MKKSSIIILLLFILAPAFSQKTVSNKQAVNLLFIGNSYVYFNQLPKLCTEVASSLGENLVTDMHAPGGFTLKQQSTDTATLRKIKMDKWNYVVLQEQSQLPSFPIEEVEKKSFPYARFLDSLIHAHNPKAKTIFYNTWGRKKGDSLRCITFPEVCTYAGMDSLLAARYQMMAKANHAMLAPVGAVWKYLRMNNPSIELYVKDGSHPSPAGSYAAACTFVTLIYKRNPEDIHFNSTLSKEDATAIRMAVKKVVYTDLKKWSY